MVFAAVKTALLATLVAGVHVARDGRLEGHHMVGSTCREESLSDPIAAAAVLDKVHVVGAERQVVVVALSWLGLHAWAQVGATHGWDAKVVSNLVVGTGGSGC